MHAVHLLVGTLVLRPYVFVFLAVYLATAGTRLGWRRTAAFTLMVDGANEYTKYDTQVVSAAIQQRLARQGIEYATITNADFAKLLGGESEKVGQIVKLSGVKPE
jgi:hypothetical protein